MQGKQVSLQASWPPCAKSHDTRLFPIRLAPQRLPWRHKSCEFQRPRKRTAGSTGSRHPTSSGRDYGASFPSTTAAPLRNPSKQPSRKPLLSARFLVTLVSSPRLTHSCRGRCRCFSDQLHQSQGWEHRAKPLVLLQRSPKWASFARKPRRGEAKVASSTYATSVRATSHPR